MAFEIFENDKEREDFLEDFFEGVDDYFYYGNNDYGVSEYNECKKDHSIIAGMRLIGFTNEDIDNLLKTYQDILIKFGARDSGSDWHYNVHVQVSKKEENYSYNRLDKDDLKYLAIAEWERSVKFRSRIFNKFMEYCTGEDTKFAVNFDSIDHGRGDLFEMGRFSVGVASINPKTDDIVFYNTSLELVTAIADSDTILNAEFDDLHSNIYLTRKDLIEAAGMPGYYANSNLFYAVEQQITADGKNTKGLFHYAMHHPAVMSALDSEMHLSDIIEDYFIDLLCDDSFIIIPRDSDDIEEENNGV